MAAIAILRNRRYFINSLNQSTCLIRGFSGFEHGQSFASNDLRRSSWVGFSTHSSEDTDREEKGGLSSITKDELSRSISLGFLRHNSFGNYGVGRSDFVSPLGPNWISRSVRYASTATAGQRDNDGKERHDAKQVKEASPEECDQAVEGLSTVKAKAKAKQVQESQKSSKSIMQKLWARLLGIGPALRAVASMSREDWAKKLRGWKDHGKATLQHYWLGTKLLWADIRISSRLLLKLVNGKGLSRRERQQLTRTTADIFRLVPLSVFLIVPFMELFLPFFLAIFPNMLPSTFQDKMKEEEALKKKLTARIELAKFLQGTVKEMAKEVQNSRSGDVKKTAKDLDEFMNKVRTGASVSNDEILGFAKLFNDELTLDNIARSRLVSMCKYMGISPYGTDAYLRYMLRRRLQEIKRDDKMIQAEGLESLSEAELRQACRDRGLLGELPVEELRQQMRDWLDLSLNHSVPSSLLILSRAFSVSGKVRPEEAVQATLSSLPDEVVDTVGVTSLPPEDFVAERRRKLEFLQKQEELIELEEKEEEEEEEQARLKKEAISSQRDVALEEMTDPTAKETLEEHEQRCEVSRALAVLASGSSVSREREEFLRLVKKEISLYNNMVENTEGEEEAKIAYRAARAGTGDDREKNVDDKVTSVLTNKVDAMLQKLEKEIDDVDAKIGDRWRLIDRDYDGKVTAEEVASAAMFLKDHLDREGIQDVLARLPKDREGKILVQDIIKLGNETDDADAEADAGADADADEAAKRS